MCRWNTRLQGFRVGTFQRPRKTLRSCRFQGYVSIAFDLEYGPDCNLLSKRVQRQPKQFIKSFHLDIKMIWLGTPCASWSRARRFDGGPRPLRDDASYLFGYPDLSAADQKRVSEGNSFLDVSKWIIDLAMRYSLRWVMENLSLLVFGWPLMFGLTDLGAKLFELHFCAYGTPWKKATGLLSNFYQLSHILKTCLPVCRRCQFTGKRHIVLSGRDNSGVWLTRRAQPYPFDLCSQISLCLRDADVSTVH